MCMIHMYTNIEHTAVFRFHRFLLITKMWQCFPIEWRWPHVLQLSRGAALAFRGAKHLSQKSSSSGLSCKHCLHFQRCSCAILWIYHSSPKQKAVLGCQEDWRVGKIWICLIDDNDPQTIHPAEMRRDSNAERIWEPVPGVLRTVRRRGGKTKNWNWRWTLT